MFTDDSTLISREQITVLNTWWLAGIYRFLIDVRSRSEILAMILLRHIYREITIAFTIRIYYDCFILVFINLTCVNKKHRVQHLDKDLLTFGIGANDVVMLFRQSIITRSFIYKTIPNVSLMKNESWNFLLRKFYNSIYIVVFLIFIRNNLHSLFIYS